MAIAASTHRTDLLHFLGTNGFAPRSCCGMLLSRTLLHFHRLPLLLVHRNENTTPQRSGQSNLEKAEVKNALNGRCRMHNYHIPNPSYAISASP